MIREVAEAKTENKVWEIVNRGRKTWKGVNEGISKEEWKEYFMGLLGGVENRLRMGGEEDRRKELEEGISKEEMRGVIRKVKEGKAMGGDDIPHEAWKFGGEKAVDIAWEMCKRVWEGEGWPQGWKEGIIVPIVKKGGGEEVKDYRGVTLMSSAYKIYAAILAGRLEKEIEGKMMIPNNQVGFRKGVGTMDNIYVLNYLLGKHICSRNSTYCAISRARDNSGVVTHCSIPPLFMWSIDPISLPSNADGEHADSTKSSKISSIY